jgi:uncharacterized protein (TIGR03067 family)
MKPIPLLASLAALLLCLLSLNATAQDGKDAIKEEMKRLEGVWVVVSGKEGDKALDTSEGSKFTFSGDRVTVENGFHKSDPVVFRLRPTKNPKQIDVEERKPPTKGIYDVKGDVLRLAYGIRRPVGFNAAAYISLILKRQKKGGPSVE